MVACGVATGIRVSRFHHLGGHAQRGGALRVDVHDDVDLRVVRVHFVVGVDDAAASVDETRHLVRRRQRRLQPRLHLRLLLLPQEPGPSILAGKRRQRRVFRRLHRPRHRAALLPALEEQSARSRFRGGPEGGGHHHRLAVPRSGGEVAVPPRLQVYYVRAVLAFRRRRYFRIHFRAYTTRLRLIEKRVLPAGFV